MFELSEIEAAQKAWGDGIVAIGAAASWEASRDLAEAFIKRMYVTEGEPLLFCPTKAKEEQFRPSLEDALSYFVGRDARHPEDAGFALQPWTGVRFENADLVLQGSIALAMGNYFFQGEDGAELKVEYSFAYRRSSEGQVQIQLHHSALPYAG